MSWTPTFSLVGPPGPPSPINFLSGGAVTVTPSQKGYIFILNDDVTFNNGQLSSENIGFYIVIKNGAEDDITISSQSTSIGTLYAKTETQNAVSCYLYWNGSQFVLY